MPENRTGSVNESFRVSAERVSAEQIFAEQISAVHFFQYIFAVQNTVGRNIDRMGAGECGNIPWCAEKEIMWIKEELRGVETSQVYRGREMDWRMRKHPRHTEKERKKDGFERNAV